MSAGDRFPARYRDEMPTEESRKTHDLIKNALLETGGGDIQHVFLSPEEKLLSHFQTYTYTPAFGNAVFEVVRSLGTLPLSDTLREFTILATAGVFKAEYLAYVHYPLAKQYTTLSDEAIETLARAEKPKDLTEEQDAVYEVVRSLHVTRGPLSDEVFNRCAQAIGKDQTISVIHYTSFYALISTSVNGADVGLPYGEEELDGS